MRVREQKRDKEIGRDTIWTWHNEERSSGGAKLEMIELSMRGYREVSNRPMVHLEKKCHGRR